MRVIGGVFGTELAKQKKSQTDELGKWLKKFNDSWSYARDNYHDRWENNWKLYKNKRTKRSHDGVVRTFVPMVNSSVNSIVASLFNSNPSVNYIPNHPDQEANTQVLNEIYADFARRDGWVQKNKVNGRQGIITGNMCAYYEWKMDKNGGYVHKENVAIRDMVIDPNSHGVDDCSYIGRRFFALKDQLAKETIFDFETGKQVKRYHDLDKIVGNDSGQSDYESDKQRKDQAIGSIAPGDDNLVELIEIWTTKEVVVIAGRQVIIEKRPNPNYLMAKTQYEQRKAMAQLEALQYEQDKAEWEARRAEDMALGIEDVGEFPQEPPQPFDEEFDEDDASFLPFAHGRIYQDISLPYGDGDVDIIADQQELLNDLTELNLEAVLYTIFPERMVDPKYSTWANALAQPRPGAVYALPQGAATWANPPQIPTNVLKERTNIKDEIRESIAVSQVSKGVNADDNSTATEIKALLGQTDVRITEKAQTLANDFFFQEAKIVFKFVQLYAPDEMWVRTIADANVDFRKVNPRSFVGDYTPMVTLEIQKKLEDAEGLERNLQTFQLLIQDPTNNLEAIKRIYYKKLTQLSDEEIQEIMAGPQQGQIPQAQMAPAGQQPVAQPVPMPQTLNLGGNTQ